MLPLIKCKKCDLYGVQYQHLYAAAVKLFFLMHVFIIFLWDSGTGFRSYVQLNDYKKLSIYLLLINKRVKGEISKTIFCSYLPRMLIFVEPTVNILHINCFASSPTMHCRKTEYSAAGSSYRSHPTKRVEKGGLLP